MKTIKRSELDGVTGWMTTDGVVRICHLKTQWHRDGYCDVTVRSPDECKRWGDTPITGDSLIAALRERGVEVIDDTQPALGGPDDEYVRKWADENGYEVEYRLPKKGEQYIEYLGTPTQCVLASPKDFNYVRCYVLTPKAKPVESKPDKWAHLPEGGEWGRFDGYTVVYHKIGDIATPYFTNKSPLNGTAMEIGSKASVSQSGGWQPISRAEAIAIFEANAKPEVKPAETPASTEADQLRKELDEAKAEIKSLGTDIANLQWTIGDQKATITRLRDSLTKAETDRQQPPMSEERFRQEAAIAAMASLNQHADVVELAEKIVASGSPITVRQMIAGKAIEYADALLAAMKGGAQ